jgi:16S rRNA (uracil1498-N3)-methyltransferase
VKFAEALNIPAVLRIVLAESEEQTLLRDVVKPNALGDGIVLAVGPEGGWTDGELELFRQAGWISASLGRTILRAETAAMAAVAVAASALNSL